MRRVWSCGAVLALLSVAGCGEPLNFTMQQEGDTQTDSASLRAAVDVNKIKVHLQALETIGPHPAGSPAHQAAVAYFEGKLKAAGYKTSQQAFSFTEYTELAPSTLAITAPVSKTYASGAAVYELGADVGYMEYSKAGTVSGQLQPTSDIVIPPGPTAGSSNSGCQATDFPAGTAGKIALVQRGTCTFLEKTQAAAAAGAIAIIIFNEGQAPDRTGTDYFTLGEASTIPAVMVSYAVGDELYQLTKNGAVSVTLKVSSETNKRDTMNLIADSVAGRNDRIVVAGGHLDSVAEGPGTNDNGSGAATLLVVAEQMAALGIAPRNKLRFAFWTAEENGLYGSTNYATALTTTEVKAHQVYLNYDMIASSNWVPMVYDGDGSDTGTAGPNGSQNVEAIMLDYFAGLGKVTYPTAFDGRSDYQGFMDRKIPIGGLFSGADEVKTAAQAALYGGVAGSLLDWNYHQPSDTLANMNLTALDVMSDATAHGVLTFAMTTSAVTGTSKSSNNAIKPPTFKGPRKIR
jgi:Zn-dependent M28 family amino/carboxypeptidase